MNPVELLHRMVEIPSLSGEEGALATFLVGAMRGLGLRSHLDEVGNVVGMRENLVSGQPVHELVLLGHLDTAPGHPPVRLEGDRLYGRGAVDAKGALATFIIAAARAALPPATRVVVIGAVEEECATSRGARHVAAHYRPAACIIGEPSGWDAVTVAYKGRLLVDYTLCQPVGHTAGPEQAVGERAVAWWLAVREYAATFNAGRDRLFDQVLPSLRHIQTTSNGLEERAEMTVGLRLPPDFVLAQAEASLRAAGGDAALRFYGYEPAFEGSRTTPLVAAFRRAIRAQGNCPRLKVKTGTSDMNVVGPLWQCPLLAYGPGDSRLDHRPDEHLELCDYRRATTVLQAVLEDKLGR